MAAQHPSGPLASAVVDEVLHEALGDAAFDDAAFDDAPDSNLEAAAALKEAGNLLFKENRYADAREKYTDAIRICPPGDRELVVYHANRAACHLKLADFDACVEDCTFVLARDASHQKALLRRAQALEHLARLEEALDDYTALQHIDAASPFINRAIRELPAKIKAQQEKSKEEMIEQLKGLGNSLLGKFGLSLDNFKMQPGPDGSYTMNFSQNASS